MKQSHSELTPTARQVLPGGFALFAPSWQAVRRNIITILEFMLLPIIGNVLAFLLFHGNNESSFAEIYSQPANQVTLGSGYVAGLVAMAIITVLLGAALTLTFLRGARGKQLDAWPALVASRAKLLPYIGLTCLTGLAVVAGMIALIVPGVLILQRLLLASYYLLDQPLTIRQALAASWRETGHYSWSVWGLLGVLVLLGLVGQLFSLGAILSNLLLLIYANAPAIRYIQIRQAETADS